MKKPIHIIRAALMQGQRLKSTCVRGQKPTRRQLLRTETAIARAINVLNDV